jgi:tRNA nucleotidyltransferase (CCA-adding enzyme)
MGNVFSPCKQPPKKDEQQPKNDCCHDFRFPFPNESYSTEYYIVGGFIRDKLLDIKSNDIDISVECQGGYQGFKEHLLKNNVKIYKENPEFLTLRCKVPKNESYISGDVDFVLCRKDGEYSDFRHPDKVKIGDINDDLSRRDFTMNAIALKVSTNTYIDKFNGIKDIENNIIRCVRNTNDRLKEDALRMVRAIRFYLVLSKLTKKKWFIEKDILLYIKHNYKDLAKIPKERVHSEFVKVFRVMNIVELNELIKPYDELQNIMIYIFTNILNLYPKIKY